MFASFILTNLSKKFKNILAIKNHKENLTINDMTTKKKIEKPTEI